MKSLACCAKKLQCLCSCSCLQLACICRSVGFLLVHFYRYILLRLNLFSIQILYFVSLSFLGFWVLGALKLRTESFRPRNLDLFFTSVSAVTVSSMSTVEMEVFSNSQLVVLTILMFMGGEVFTSMAELHLGRFKRNSQIISENKIESPSSNLSPSSPPDIFNGIELGSVTLSNLEKSDEFWTSFHPSGTEDLRYTSTKFLSFVVLGYLLVTNVIGIIMVLVYVVVVSSARHVLRSKDLNLVTFSIFTTVSTFTNCGFVPTKENMIVFSKNSGLLLILIPQVLLGNTLFASCLRFLIWVLGKFVKKEESKYLLKNTRDIGYPHLLPSLHSSLQVVTVFGFIIIQCVLFCYLEWKSAALAGLSSYQKFVGTLFQTLNSRHAGQTIVDLSIVSPAILVLFVAMMYLPPYTSFLPIRGNGQCSQEYEGEKRRRGKVEENLIFSQLSYLVIFIILVCITERKKMKEDPLNFNVLSIVVEVISAYGNVGFSMGYSCERQLKPDAICKDKWYGFSGKWSDEGKIILIVVMFFGRLKKFNMNGGQAWKLL